MAITSSFQLQIVYRLKLWTSDFPIFKTIYSMHEMKFWKWSKCVQQFPKWGGANFAQVDMVVRISHKWSSVVRISHNVRIPVHFRTKILGRDRKHAFWKMLTKAISHKGVRWCEFRTRELGGVNFPVSWLFSPVFPLTSFFKLSYIADMYLQTSLVIECEPCSSKMWRSTAWTALDPLFLASPTPIIKKPKLNQTKIK